MGGAQVPMRERRQLDTSISAKRSVYYAYLGGVAPFVWADFELGADVDMEGRVLVDDCIDLYSVL